MESNPSIKTLENQLREAKQRNADLTAELSSKKQALKDFLAEAQSNNKLFQLYNALNKSNIDYQTLMDLEDIPIPDDLKNAIHERSEADKELKQIVKFIAGQDISEEILNNENKSIELLDEYIKISNQM